MANTNFIKKLKLKRRLLGLYPDEKISYLGEGVDCAAFSIGNTAVAKLPKHPRAEIKLKNEREILRLLSRSPISDQVPTLLSSQESETDGQYFSVVSRLNGAAMTPRRFGNLSDSEKEDFACDLAEFLRSLHTIPFENEPILKIDPLSKYAEDEEFLLKRLGSEFAKPLSQSISRFYRNLSEFYRKNPIRFAATHGDLSLDAIFFDEDRFVGVIDFGDGAITDADVDFIYLLENEEDYPLEFGKRVFELYGFARLDLIFKKIAIDHAYWDLELAIRGLKFQEPKFLKQGLKGLSQTGKAKSLDRVFEL